MATTFKESLNKAKVKPKDTRDDDFEISGWDIWENDIEDIGVGNGF